MQTFSSYPADAIAFGRHRADLPDADLDLSAYPAVRPLGPTPATIRAHVGRREFGSFAAALAKADPTAERLRGVVDRARARGQRHPIHVASKSEPSRPQLVKLREFADDATNSLFNRLMAAVIIVMAVWIGAPVALTLIAGAM